MFAADGEVEAVAGSTRDVTEREKMRSGARREVKRDCNRYSQQAPVAILRLRGRDFVFELVKSLL